jgi:hypothetical protein
MVEANGITWRDLLRLDDAALLAQCDVDRFRASGPGGQKRNKTDSAVRLRHPPSGISAQAFESRSQHENRARALRRLRLEAALRLRAPVEDGPPPETAEAIRSGKLAVGRRDARYPSVVAGIFDVLEARSWRLAEAAGVLGLSTAALVRFLAEDPVVLRAADERRQAVGLGVIHVS